MDKSKLRKQWRAASKKWRNSNRAKVKAMVKDWQRRNPEKCKEYSRRGYSKHRLDRIAHQKVWFRKNRARIVLKARRFRMLNPATALIWSARARAKKRKIPFSICEHDFEIPKKCPVLGIEIIYSNKKTKDSSPSLDRLKPSLGYVPGNVCVVSWRANRIKNDATVEEVRKLLKYMETKIGGQSDCGENKRIEDR